MISCIIGIFSIRDHIDKTDDRIKKKILDFLTSFEIRIPLENDKNITVLI